MSKCRYIQPIQQQVKFGVELRELFPPWYLHPTLKNLIYLAETNIRTGSGTRFDVEEVLGKGYNGEGSVKQRLQLKECMITGKNLLDLTVAPGVPIWLIRHFLGLLPTQIFPPKADPDYWLNFTTRYFEQFVLCLKTRKSSDDLKYDVAFEIAHLPSRNVTFLFEFFDLLKFLSSKTISDSSEVLDKHASLLLVRYYAPCLFVRPYRPGFVAKTDRKYISFILYVVYFWTDIRDEIHDILISSINKNENKFYYFPDHYYDSKYSCNNDYLKDFGTQTDDNAVKKHTELSLCLENISDMSDELAVDLEQVHSIYKDINYRDSKTSIRNDLNNHEATVLSSTPCSKSKSAAAEDTLHLAKKKHSNELNNSQTQTSFNSAKSKRNSDIKLSKSNKGSKTKTAPKKIRTTLKKSTNYDIIILKIPYKVRRLRSRHVKIITFKKYSNKSPEKSPKCCKKEHVSPKIKKKINFKIDEVNKDKKLKEDFHCNGDDEQNNLNSTELSSIKYNITPNNSSLNAGEYIYDTFIGKCLSEEKCSKNPFKSDLHSSSYIDFNSPVKSVDLYDKITKYGWTYTQTKKSLENESNVSLQSPKLDQYKICFDTELNSTINSLSPLNEEDAISNNLSKEKSNKSFVDHLKEVGSKLNFFKFIIKKSTSFDDLRCRVKYGKILKYSKSI